MLRKQKFSGLDSVCHARASGSGREPGASSLKLLFALPRMAAMVEHAGEVPGGLGPQVGRPPRIVELGIEGLRESESQLCQLLRVGEGVLARGPRLIEKQATKSPMMEDLVSLGTSEAVRM